MWAVDGSSWRYLIDKIETNKLITILSFVCTSQTKSRFHSAVLFRKVLKFRSNHLPPLGEAWRLGGRPLSRRRRVAVSEATALVTAQVAHLFRDTDKERVGPRKVGSVDGRYLLVVNCRPAHARGRARHVVGRGCDGRGGS